jgi:hypothetical protein
VVSIIICKAACSYSILNPPNSEQVIIIPKEQHSSNISCNWIWRQLDTSHLNSINELDEVITDNSVAFDHFCMQDEAYQVTQPKYANHLWSNERMASFCLGEVLKGLLLLWSPKWDAKLGMLLSLEL